MHIFSDKRCRRTGAYFLFFFLVIALLRLPQQVFADPAGGTGTISGDNVFVRNEPGIEGTTMLVAVDAGQPVNIIGQTTVDGKTWYQVTCTVGDTSYTGWTYGMYVTVNDSDTTAASATTGGTGSPTGTGSSSTGTGSNSAESSSSGTGNNSAGSGSTGTDTSSSNSAGAQDVAESEEPEGTVKEFTVNGYVLHPADMIPEAIIPVGFSEDTITIDGAEYPCLSFSDGEMKFLYLLEEGETSGQLYLYDDLRDTVCPFLQLESESGYLVAALPGGQQLLGSFFEDGGTYQFDTTVSAYPRYVFSSGEETAEDTADEQQAQDQLEQDYAKLEAAYNKLQQKDSRMQYIGFGIIGVLLLVIIVLIATRGKAKPEQADEIEDEDDWDKEDWEEEEHDEEEDEDSEETVVEEEELPEEELPAIDIAAVVEEVPQVEEVSAEGIAVAPEIQEEETSTAEEEPAVEIAAAEEAAVPEEIPTEETVTAPELPDEEDDDDDDLVFIDL